MTPSALVPELVEAIPRRRSTRSFTGLHLTPDTISALQQFASRVPALPLDPDSPEPSAFSLRFSTLTSGADNPDQGIRLGSYGVIRGASDLLTLIAPAPADNSTLPRITLIAAAFKAQWIVLRLTSLNLGSCWMSGTIRRPALAADLGLEPSDLILAVIPFGHPRNKSSLTEKIMRAAVGSNSRKKFDSLFTIPADCPSQIIKALECVRLGPSGCNRQPWRASVSIHPDTLVTFTCHDKSSDMNALDMGIALANFYLASGCTGTFHLSPDALTITWTP